MKNQDYYGIENIYKEISKLPSRDYLDDYFYPDQKQFNKAYRHFQGEGIMLWGHRPKKQNNWLRNTLLVILFIVAAIVLWKIAEPGNKAYNKHMCAVYGLDETCKTPLPPELRLK